MLKDSVELQILVIILGGFVTTSYPFHIYIIMRSIVNIKTLIRALLNKYICKKCYCYNVMLLFYPVR